MRRRSYLVAKMKKLKPERFTNAAVEVSILEKRLMTKANLETILRAENFKQVQGVLLTAGYRHFPSQSVGQMNIHNLLNAYLADFFEELLALVPEEETEFLDMLLLDFDVHNVQAALMQRENGPSAASHTIAIPKSRHSFYARRLAQREPEKGYFARLLDQAEEQFAESPRVAQAWLDGEYYRRLSELAKESGMGMFIDYAQAKADFFNLLTVLRMRGLHARSGDVPAAMAVQLCAGLMAPGGSLSADFLTGLFSLNAEEIERALEDTKYRRVFREGLSRYSYENDSALVEKEMDNYLTQLVAAKRYAVMGPETLFGYFYARRIEVTNLRLVLAVRLQGMPEAAARERLRDLYV